MTAPLRFQPRRLGHVNLWVSDLENSIRFYEQVCGIEFVRRERLIKIGFHSNGNTHHDVGLVEISRGTDRVGRDGRVQIPATRGIRVELNHLGWEMNNEAELVEAYRRADAVIRPQLRTADHLISHSIYINDPDGNSHEFYADAIRDWRSIYNLDREDEVSGLWSPGDSDGDASMNYDPAPTYRRVAHAPLHPSHLIGARFATHGFDAMAAFFVETAGLTATHSEINGQRCAMLSGRRLGPDLELREVAPTQPSGLRAFRFRLLDDAIDDDRLMYHCKAFGVAPPRRIDGERGPMVALTDPDRFDMEFVATHA
jgi:catechol 2,3-dioxygenase